MVRSLGALLLAGVLAATAGAQPSGTDAEIHSLLEKYEQSVNDLNLDLAEEIWSQDSDVSFIHPRGHERGWPDIRANFYLGTMGGLPTRHLQIRDIEVHPLTEDSAWVEFYWNFEATRPNGMELSTSGRETQVLRRENGAWQIRNVHYSAMPTQVEGEGF